MTMTEPDAVHFWLAMSSAVTFGITWVMSSAPGHSWLCFNPAALVSLSLANGKLQWPELV